MHCCRIIHIIYFFLYAFFVFVSLIFILFFFSSVSVVSIVSQFLKASLALLPKRSGVFFVPFFAENIQFLTFWMRERERGQQQQKKPIETQIISKGIYAALLYIYILLAHIHTFRYMSMSNRSTKRRFPNMESVSD